MIDWKRKLSSRKFWAAVSGVVIAVMMAMGDNAEAQERVAGVISSVGVLAVYILSEGAVDKAAAEKNDVDE
ncbi:MAG: hypothetical protein ACI4RH_07285 [Huintestinicola sp.]